MNLILVLLALTCAASAYSNGVYVAKQINYRRSEEPLASAEIAVEATGEGNRIIPAFTEWLRDIDNAASELKRHLLRPDSNAYNPNDPFVQYVMIVNAINQLIDASLDGEYDRVFYDVVSRVILETVNAPQEFADKVRAQADKTISKILAIRDLIVQKQETSCDEDISYTCDLIVGIAVETSEDALLKLQAELIGVLSREAELFLNGYAEEFNDKSNNKKVPAFLINGIDILRPLVMAGVNTRNLAKNIPPTRRSGGFYRHQMPWLF